MFFQIPFLSAAPSRVVIDFGAEVLSRTQFGLGFHWQITLASTVLVFSAI
jgi:hypothetical protein